MMGVLLVQQVAVAIQSAVKGRRSSKRRSTTFRFAQREPVVRQGRERVSVYIWMVVNIYV